MDPNANLREQLELAQGFIHDLGEYSADDVLRLAELVIGLNEWIVKGGFIPDSWGSLRQRKTV